MANDAQNQSYDNLLKRLLENQPTVIIPLLFPDLVSEVIEELNIELLVPPRRTDRVYKTRPEDPAGEPEIMHIEFESSSNGKMDKRLLIYHALLLEKYELPINSLIVYPFEVSMVTPPLKERKGLRELLSFEYQTVPLWKLDARTYVERRAVPLYGLLPAMQGINSDLLLQVIDDMVEYYGDDEAHLRDELLCFRVLLARAKRLPEAELLRVERRVRMFDPLLEEDPWVQEKVAESKAKGIAEGKAKGIAEGELKALRSALVAIVGARFPSLIELVKTKTAQIEQPDVLNVLVVQISAAADEQAARDLLEMPFAS